MSEDDNQNIQLSLTKEQYENIIVLLAATKRESKSLFKSFPEQFQNEANKLFISPMPTDDIDLLLKKIYIMSEEKSISYYSDTKLLTSVLENNKELAQELISEYLKTSNKNKYISMLKSSAKYYIEASLIKSNNVSDKLKKHIKVNSVKTRRGEYIATLYLTTYQEAKKDIDLISHIVASHSYLAKKAVELADSSILPYLVNVSNYYAKQALEQRMKKSK